MRSHTRTLLPKRPLCYRFFIWPALLGLAALLMPCAPILAEDAKNQPGLVVSGDPFNGFQSPTLLICLGDSLGHGTMDAANNATNTLNAYAQKVAESLSREIPLVFNQPLFTENGQRMDPYLVPSNLAVDGADIFSLAGIEYRKRVGAERSYISRDLLSDRLLPTRLKDNYDRVMYPINVLAGHAVSQVGSATWLLETGAPTKGIDQAIVILWAGNNDSSLAALGAGGGNPQYQPLPFDVLDTVLSPPLRLLLAYGEQQGLVSFEPYTPQAIERNLTDVMDFALQYLRVVRRLNTAQGIPSQIFLLTLPYYSSVGYLMDSDDLEFYLRKIDPDYSIPPSFQRAATPGEPAADSPRGDRISLLTFGMMYALLSTGHDTDTVNRVLEVDGTQRDGMVLSEAEQAFIMSRIDAYNAIIRWTAANSGPNFHLVDIGDLLNSLLTGESQITIDGRVLSRRWGRGHAFCLDGVHPGYTGQAFIANKVIEHLNAVLGLQASLHDLTDVFWTDPYADQDGDGWVPGPVHEPSGIAELLFLFTDPDDEDPAVQPRLPQTVWEDISRVLLREILGIREISVEANRMGLLP